MGFAFVNKENLGNFYILIDSEDDLSIIPKTPKASTPGTIAELADGSKRFRLNTKREWIPLSASGEEGIVSKYGYGMPRLLRKKEDYFWSAVYSELDYEAAFSYFLSNDDARIGGCSAFAIDGVLYRNLDWVYGKQAEAFVKTPGTTEFYAVDGFAGGIGAITDEFLSRGGVSELLKILPFQLQDGINEAGLQMCMNVVPMDYGAYSDASPKPTSVSGLMLVRYVLDRCKSVPEAVSLLGSVSVFFPEELHDMGYELHYLLTDANGSKVIEFAEGEMRVIDASAITNFYLYGVTFNDDGTVYTPESMDEAHDAVKTNGITANGSGLERYNLIVTMLADNEEPADILTALRYTNSYSGSPNEANPHWYTEFVGESGLTVDTPASEFADAYAEAGMKFAERSRSTGETWHTTHSVSYEKSSGALTAKYTVQELSSGEEATRVIER